MTDKPKRWTVRVTHQPGMASMYREGDPVVFDGNKVGHVRFVVGDTVTLDIHPDWIDKVSEAMCAECGFSISTTEFVP